METVLPVELGVGRLDFLNFLRGMETQNAFDSHPLSLLFLNFLRGMETHIHVGIDKHKHTFLNFLRGMETGFDERFRVSLPSLPKLP